MGNKIKKNSRKLPLLHLFMWSVTPVIHDCYNILAITIVLSFFFFFFYPTRTRAHNYFIYKNELCFAVRCHNVLSEIKILNQLVRSTLFSSKSSFAQMLPSLLKHPSHVEQISQYLTSDLKLFKQYGILFLEQLSDQTFAIKPIIVLSCFNRYFAQYLADNKESLKDVVDEARLIMFSYCLKVRNLSIYSKTVSFCKRSNI